MPNEIQRVNYHTGLFLEEAEFKLEQNYHLMMRRRLNYAMFTPGVLYGLSLSLNSQTNELTVNPGMAIDEITVENGETISREIIVMNPYKVTLASLTGDVWITICHDPKETDPKPPTNRDSRITENYKVETLTSEPKQLRDKILLSNIKIGETFTNREPIQKSALKLWDIPAPIITRLNIESGKPKDNIEIYGGHFIGITQVLFGSESASFEIWSDSLVKAIVPDNAQTGKIKVISPAGYDESDRDFVVKLEPTITDFDPKKANVGAYVTITGTNLVGTSEVFFGDKTTDFIVISNTQISAKVPAGIQKGKIKIQTSSGPVVSAEDFEVSVEQIPPPTISHFNPTAGFVGTSVTITGTKFTGSSSVRFGNVPTSIFSVISDTQISASVPAEAASGKITVITPGGSNTSISNFTVTIPAPKIVAIEPEQGGIGTTIRIKGENFNGINLSVLLVKKESAEGEREIREREELATGGEVTGRIMSGARTTMGPIAGMRATSMVGGLVMTRAIREREETEYQLQINSRTNNQIDVTIPKISTLVLRVVGSMIRISVYIRVRTDSGASEKPFLLSIRG